MKLKKLSEVFHVDFVLSIALDESDLPEDLKSMVAISL